MMKDDIVIFRAHVCHIKQPVSWADRSGYDAMLHESGTLLPPDEPPRGWQQQQQQPAVPAAGGWPAAAAAAPQEAAAVLGGAAEDGTPISPPVSTGGTERYFN